MKRWAVLACIVVVGLPVGFLGAMHLSPRSERPLLGMAIFTEYCLPLVRHQWPDVAPPLSPVNVRASEEQWLDPVTGWLLTRNDRHCGISDTERPLTRGERNRLSLLAAEWVSRNLAMLRAEQPDRPADIELLDVWAQHPPGDQRRWRVTLTHLASGQDGETTLTLTVPREPLTP